MATLAEIKSRLRELNLEAVGTIKEDLSKIEQNPNIHMTSTSPHCYTISHSKLNPDLILDPTYYDFEQQRDTLIRGVEKKKTLEECLIFLQRAVKERKVQQGGEHCVLHPVMVEKIQEILGEA